MREDVPQIPMGEGNWQKLTVSVSPHDNYFTVLETIKGITGFPKSVRITEASENAIKDAVRLGGGQVITVEFKILQR